MLEALEAAEELPVGVLDPARHRLLVGEVKDGLEIVQADHQPGRLGRPADRLVEAAERRVEFGPRHHPGQPHQRVLQIDDGVQPLAEQVLAATWLLRRSHRKTPENVASGLAFRYLPILRFPRKSLSFNKFQLSQGGLNRAQPAAPLICPGSQDLGQLYLILTAIGLLNSSFQLGQKLAI